MAQRRVVYVPCRGMADGDGAATGNTLASGVHDEDDVKSPLIATRARTHGQWDVCLHGTGTVSFPHRRSTDTVSSLLPPRNDGDDDDTTRNTGPVARTPLVVGSPRPFSSRPLSVSLVSPPQPAPWPPLRPFDPEPKEKEDLPAPSSANCPDTLLSLALSLASAVHLVSVSPWPAPSFPRCSLCLCPTTSHTSLPIASSSFHPATRGPTVSISRARHARPTVHSRPVLARTLAELNFLRAIR